VKPLHDLNVQGLERVAGRLDEVDTRVDTVVDDVHAVDLVLGIEIGVEALLDVLDDGPPRIVVVDEVAETRGVDDRQAEADTVLLDVSADGLDVDRARGDLERRALALLRGVEGAVEQGVDESRLSETGFTWSCQSRRLVPSGARPEYIPTTMTLKLKPLRTLLRCHWFGRLAKPT
jgi:hypothetical protein